MANPFKDPKFDKINTAEDVRKTLASVIRDGDSNGKKLIVLTAALCRMGPEMQRSIGYFPKNGLPTLACLRKYFKDTFGVENADETARKMITRATAFGFAVSETMPSFASANDMATICNAAHAAYQEWKVDAAAQAKADKEAKAAKEAAAKAAEKALNDARMAAHAEHVASVAKAGAEAESLLQGVSLNVEEGVTLYDLIKALFEQGDKATLAAAHVQIGQALEALRIQEAQIAVQNAHPAAQAA